jgi:molybdopterin-guanine dinucleotide biosynthesis protein A
MANRDNGHDVQTLVTGAAILAGGSSKRMGTNKALLRLRPGGPTLIETVVARLQEAGLADGLIVVANEPDEYAFLGLPVVPDEIAGAGPLGGILTALIHSTCERVLVVACDMPALNSALLGHLARLTERADVVIPRWVGSDGKARLETLHAVYSHTCIPAMLMRIEAGQLSVHGLLEDVAVCYVEEEDLRALDPDLESFRNINRPTDIKDR